MTSEAGSDVETVPPGHAILVGRPKPMTMSRNERSFRSITRRRTTRACVNAQFIAMLQVIIHHRGRRLLAFSTAYMSPNEMEIDVFRWQQLAHDPTSRAGRL